MPTNTGPTGQRASAIWSDFGGKIKFKKGVISNPPHHGFVGRVSTRPTTTARGTGAVGMNPDLQHTATSHVGRVSTRPTTAAHGTGVVGMNPDLQHHRSWHPRRRDESRPTWQFFFAKPLKFFRRRSLMASEAQEITLPNVFEKANLPKGRDAKSPSKGKLHRL